MNQINQVKIIDDEEHNSDNNEAPMHYIPTRVGRGGRKGKQKGGPFREDLKKLMFGFGDDRNPHEATVDLLEIYIEEFVINLVA